MMRNQRGGSSSRGAANSRAPAHQCPSASAGSCPPIWRGPTVLTPSSSCAGLSSSTLDKGISSGTDHPSSSGAAVGQASVLQEDGAPLPGIVPEGPSVPSSTTLHGMLATPEAAPPLPVSMACCGHHDLRLTGMPSHTQSLGLSLIMRPPIHQTSRARTSAPRPSSRMS